MAWMCEPNIAYVMMWVYIYDNAHIRIDELEKPLYPGVYCWTISREQHLHAMAITYA